VTDDGKTQTVGQLIGRNLRAMREAEGESQDKLAERVRAAGLNWSRSTIAALEAGTKTLDVGEFALLSVALLQPPERLLAGPGWIEAAPGARMTAEALRRVHNGSEAFGEITMADLDTPEIREARETWAKATTPALAEGLEETQRRFATYQRIVPRFTHGQLRAAQFAARNDAEMKAARKLHLDDAVEVAFAALRLWGRSLTEERDARVSAMAPPDASPRTLQALRGHITRQLLEELEPVLIVEEV
jgi:transcriptional regulator with XRE-family HTH domain